ncbi:hypothetical protein ACLOJK_039370 [Asimina triloba]
MRPEAPEHPEDLGVPRFGRNKPLDADGRRRLSRQMRSDAGKGRPERSAALGLAGRCHTDPDLRATTDDRHGLANLPRKLRIPYYWLYKVLKCMMILHVEQDANLSQIDLEQCCLKVHLGVPLLYVPLEVVMSKYYGESERLLGTVFSLANDLSNGAIIFLDEVDSFAVARDSGMHEATRRILSVILRQIDGFEQENRVVVIAATNRKQDLDPALIRHVRFDSMITFGLPDQQTRVEIVAQYARHLTKSELVQFAAVTEEMSGRDIRDVCQQAERHWASKIIRGEASGDDSEQRHGLLPPIQEYIQSANNRRKALQDVSDKKNQMSDLKNKPLAFA